jgi:hypothetical protein
MEDKASFVLNQNKIARDKNVTARQQLERDHPELLGPMVAPFASPQAEADKAQRLGMMSYRDQLGLLQKKAQPIEDKLATSRDLIENISNPTGVGDSVAVPELLKVMVSGQGSGFRMTQAEMNSVLGGRPAYDELKARLAHWKAGTTLGPQQRQQMLALAQHVQTKLANKAEAFQWARTNLVGTADPNEHHKIMNRMYQEVNDIDAHPLALRDPAGKLRFFDNQNQIDHFKQAAGIP